MRLRVPWLLVLALWSALGCDPTDADCRQLVARLNAAVDRLGPRRVTDAGPPAEVATAMRTFAEAVGAEADALDALPLEAPELVAQRDAYVAAARRSAEAARAWAEALDAMTRAQTAGDAAKKALDDNLDRLEERCEGSTCHELMQRLARSADVPLRDLPDALDALADDLAGITTEVAEIDEAIARHRDRTRDLAKALRAMREAEAAAGAQREALAQAGAMEAPVVDRINAICRR